MAEGPGRGRGGRGALIAKLLELQKQPGPPPANGSPPRHEPVPEAVEDAPPVRRVGGRGAMLQSLLQQQAAAASPTPPPAVVPVPEVAPVPVPEVEPPPVPRGRGALLQRALEQQLMTQGLAPAQQSAEPPPPPAPAVAVEGKGEGDIVEGATKQMRRMRIDPETPPVLFQGTSGRQIPVTANYIPLYLKEGRGIFEYEIRFTPTVDDKVAIEKMIFMQHREIFRGTRKTFDGVTLYLPHKLDEKDCSLESEHPVTKEVHRVSVIFRRQRKMTECVHMYNLLFNNIQRELKYVKLKDKEFFIQEKAVIIPNHKLEVWPGYVTTVDVMEGGIKLMVNNSSKVLRTQTVLDLIGDLVSGSGSRDWRTTLQKLLIGESVMVRHNVRTYRVDDIDFSKNPMSTFECMDGTSMTYVEYHRRKNIEIRDHQQPLLVHRTKARVSSQRGGDGKEQLLLLVPELCTLTGLTDEMRSDFKVMKDVGMHTRLNPNQRQQCIQNFLDSIRENPACVKLLDEWGLKVPEKTINLTARVLDPETIIFRNHQERGSANADWSRAATSKHMLEPVPLGSWLVICAQRDDKVTNSFIEMMGKICPQLGVNCQYPELMRLRDDRTETYLTGIKAKINTETQMVVIIFPTSRDDRYSAVKKLLCVDMPIPSQVINARTISRQDKLRSVVQKIALQINCKLGGALWGVQIPFKRAMICGIDTYHDTKSRAHCVAGFVASVNQTVTRWYSQTIFSSTAGRELVDGIQQAVHAALNKYYEINNFHPDTIVVFRDGVGDGQIKMVQEHEIPAFEKAFKSVGPHYNPGMAFIICQKRINARIFQPVGQNNYDNPPPGTVVDHTITRRYYEDFYLVSQMVRQGTVTPTHYIVIHNTTRLDAEKIQRITFKMSHLYYNWPGTVRVPAPCQYAHKLAYLVGCNLHKKPAHILCDKLFFL